MDVNDLRVAVTVLSFLLFGGIVRWALSARNKPAFDEAQQLPFLETGADDE
jgi:cytochrome c oxidase cbb3-type subunit 4